MSAPLGIYRAVTGLAQPVAGLALRLYAREEPPELHAERLGAATGPRGAVWWHAASLGEVAALEPVLREAAARGYDRFSVTTTTVPGRERAAGFWGERAGLAPLDFPATAARALDARNPSALVLVETELWPNLLDGAQRRGIPVGMVNARISDRSWPRYRRLRRLFRGLADRVSAVAARSEADAERLLELGVRADALRVAGNTKLDRYTTAPDPIPLPWPEGPVWAAASVHPGELEVLVEVHRLLRERVPGLRLVLAPRHPDDPDGWTARLRDAGFAVARRSRPTDADAGADALLVDTLGELPGFLAAAGAAFIGGTLVPVGGHNPLEASAAGVPVVMGPYTANVREEVGLLREAGALVAAGAPGAIADAISDWLLDGALRERAGNRVRAVIRDASGAAGRSVDWLVERRVLRGEVVS